MDDATLYVRIGGETGVRGLVDRFYDAMSELEGARTVRAMHPTDDRGSREKLFMFLSGWMGGPQLYVEKYGHPRLRMRHFPFAIDDAAALAWLDCMDVALEPLEDDGLRARLQESFARVAAHMRNRQ